MHGNHTTSHYFCIICYQTTQHYYTAPPRHFKDYMNNNAEEMPKYFKCKLFSLGSVAFGLAATILRLSF